MGILKASTTLKYLYLILDLCVRCLFVFTWLYCWSWFLWWPTGSATLHQTINTILFFCFQKIPLIKECFPHQTFTTKKLSVDMSYQPNITTLLGLIFSSFFHPYISCHHHICLGGNSNYSFMIMQNNCSLGTVVVKSLFMCFLSLKLFLIDWNIVSPQCCVSVRFPEKWFSYTYISYI